MSNDEGSEMSKRDGMWVNVLFKGRALAEFQQVQAHLGISTRTDVLRHLVHQKAMQLEQQRREEMAERQL